MRHKDENKSRAIFQATIELLNEIGLSEISMSKIAKRTKVSVATIYIYFENKEDMLSKIYLSVKEKMSETLTRNINGTTPVKEGCERFIRNSLNFMLDNKDEFLFMEQFSNSPLVANLTLEDTSPMFESLAEFVRKGQEQQILKQVDGKLILEYCYLPAANLAKAHLKGSMTLTDDKIEEVISMSWDAIKA